MLLQPLVENAVKHGLEPKIEGGRVDISCALEDGVLAARIMDTGLGLGGGSTKGTGIGLAHVRERLAAAYGGTASLEIVDRSPNGVTVAVRIPVAK
jgi:LytS/YehU family sensor histidine kinase